MPKIHLAGHQGMVGSAILRQLQARANAGEEIEILTRSHAELDLTDAAATREFYQQHRPDAVILAAARVGGILANQSWPADFIRDNLMIGANVVHEACAAGVPRLVQIGSSAVYPSCAAQPMREEALLSGPLDPVHEPYALAKLATLKMCESYNRQHGTDYRTVLPTNLYGPGDNFDAETSHVLAALLRRFHAAAESGAEVVTLWGTGTPRREFLHVDDAARGVLFVLDLPPQRLGKEISPMRSALNLGCGQDLTILELAQKIAQITGFEGRIETDPSKPDGVARKLLDVGRMTRLGWQARIPLDDGLRQTYAWFRETPEGARPPDPA